ncbi:hypothetical protein [Polaromonas sp.]|uniref:hypothetical protein n=1 Tax=Polaromonas sp. TaxID=1869339 RepID=UPI002FC685E4
MAKVSIKGIIIGTVVMLLLDLVGGIALMIALGGASLYELPQEGQGAAIAEFAHSLPYLTGSVIIGLLITVLGGYLAARIAKREAYLNSGMLGVVGVVIGLFLAEGLPLWFNAVAFLLTIPAALLGGHLAKGKPGNA